jgi:hypothetical protein
MVRFKSIDYRRLYIEQPRVRLDGVYIAVCHYVCDLFHFITAFTFTDCFPAVMD